MGWSATGKIRGPQGPAGGQGIQGNPGAHYPSYLRSQRLARPWLEDVLASEGNGSGAEGGSEASGSSRPSRGVLWPRGSPS